ncbi:MAG: 3-deoxy-D-manno-octulosonic acid kinase [Tateyamaria sp.]|uniref:3-deoxy-D-manno-octulosonic acid kinase n=1 Tax=Tateyamaria sp. TaxID=1929288 RepID=UPI0032915007
MTPSDLHQDGTIIRFDATVLPTMEPHLFDAQWLRANGFWQGSTQGRSQAHFFRYADHDMVLRHFHRGGLIGRVNRDLYLRVKATNSRALREFDLLCDMHSEGLPVPLPVAARYVPFGPGYRADIITQRIPNALPLQEVLGDRALSAQLWNAIGANVRNLHDHGVYHSDLNCRNILMDTSDQVWFIDFDKCEKREPGTWAQANLDRLLRSLRKTAAGPLAMHWRETDWADFLAGYDSGYARAD